MSTKSIAKELLRLGVLSSKELKKLGVRRLVTYGALGFVDVGDKRSVKRLEALVATGKYDAVAWCCEVALPGFASASKRVYGLVKVSHPSNHLKED